MNINMNFILLCSYPFQGEFDGNSKFGNSLDVPPEVQPLEFGQKITVSEPGFDLATSAGIILYANLAIEETIKFFELMKNSNRKDLFSDIFSKVSSMLFRAIMAFEQMNEEEKNQNAEIYKRLNLLFLTVQKYDLIRYEESSSFGVSNKALSEMSSEIRIIESSLVNLSSNINLMYKRNSESIKSLVDQFGKSIDTEARAEIAKIESEIVLFIFVTAENLLVSLGEQQQFAQQDSFSSKLRTKVAEKFDEIVQKQQKITKIQGFTKQLKQIFLQNLNELEIQEIIQRLQNGRKKLEGKIQILSKAEEASKETIKACNRLLDNLSKHYKREIELLSSDLKTKSEEYKKALIQCDNIRKKVEEESIKKEAVGKIEEALKQMHKRVVKSIQETKEVVKALNVALTALKDTKKKEKPKIIGVLEKIIKSLNENLKNFQKEADILVKIKDQVSQISKGQTGKKLLESLFKNIQEKNEATSAKLLIAQKDNLKASEELKGLVVERQNNQRTIAELNRKLESQIKQLSVVSANYEKKISSGNSKIKELSEQLSYLQSIGEQKNSETEELKEKIKTLMEERQKEIAQLEKEHEAATKEFESEIEQTVNSLKSSNAAVKKLNALIMQLEEKIKSLESQLEEHKENKKKSESQHEEHKKKIAVLTSENEELEKKLSNIRKTNEQQNEEISKELARLKAELTEKNTELSKRDSVIAELKSRVEAEAKEKEKLVAENAKLSVEKAKLVKEIKKLQTSGVIKISKSKGEEEKESMLENIQSNTNEQGNEDDEVDM